MWHPLRLVAVILGLALMAASCTSSDSGGDPSSIPSPSPRAIRNVDSYVALGDSYAAGPGISPIVSASGACRRSKDNWPSLLADALRAKTFADVTCTGAPTSHLTSAFTPRGGSSTRPQLDAVDGHTQLITVTMGGNDGGTFPGILTVCTDILNQKGKPCSEFVNRRLPGMLDEVKDGVERGLTDIRRKAPQATVLLVGYFRVAPDKGGCDELGTTGARARLEARAEKKLDESLASAAKAAGVGFLSLRKASTGHDACAGDDAWINGLTPQAGSGAPLHPNAAAMRAAADAVAARLRQG